MKQDDLEISIRGLPSEAERAHLYERLLEQIGHDDAVIRYQALERLADAFRTEAGEDADEQPVDRLSLPARLESILAAIERTLTAHPDLLEQFCSRFYDTLSDMPESQQVCDWLERLAASGDRCSVPAAALLAARIVFGAYGATWGEAGDRLLVALDHEDLTVRACAAYQIARFCCRLVPADAERDAWDRDHEADRRATDRIGKIAICTCCFRSVRSRPFRMLWCSTRNQRAPTGRGRRRWRWSIESFRLSREVRCGKSIRKGATRGTGTAT